MPGDSGKGRKIGRNSVKCKRYKDNNTQMKNQLRKVLRHLRKHNIDNSVMTVLKNAQAKLSIPEFRSIVKEIGVVPVGF